ncbi:hypothetical protein BD626DRAFT_503591 [Schizophyllum amplum]|uniref:Uncharacterized protein n=1 Tax=Schizophyllum amplum TaxID=97359 RepID=A0A550C7D5_9AGAR|nr:hypothetical protein BD626DRAFT_503591 [Auriculariopsis ampla]
MTSEATHPTAHPAALYPNAPPGPYVQCCIRGGYPITHAEAFRWATLVAEGTDRHPPKDLDDLDRAVHLLDLIFCKYNDLDCFPVTNPNDPEGKEMSWLVATTPRRYEYFPKAEIDEKLGKNEDFWTPSIQLEQSYLDTNAKEALERKGFKLQSFHTAFWSLR